MNIKKKERPILVDISLKEKREGVVRVKIKQAGATRKRPVLGEILHSADCALDKIKTELIEKQSKECAKELQKEHTCTIPIIPPPGNILEIGGLEEQPTAGEIKNTSRK